MCRYKANILTYLEDRNFAIYYASSTLPQQIDSIQSKVLRKIGIVYINALRKYARRDMGMLGIIHRTVLEFRGHSFSSILNLQVLHFTHREETITRDTMSNYKHTEDVNSLICSGNSVRTPCVLI